MQLFRVICRKGVVYSQVVNAAQREPLDELIKRASQVNVALRSPAFCFMCACFRYFTRQRFLAFLLRLEGDMPKFRAVGQKFYENCDRLLDETTWVFIAHCRSLSFGTLWWQNVFFWLLRSIYTCTPRAYTAGHTYANMTGENQFNTRAYNTHIGNNACFRPVLQSCLEVADEASECLKTLVMERKVGKAVEAGYALKGILLKATGLAEFNVKELLWGGVLLREARDYSAGRNSSEELRKKLFEQSLYGTGAVRGMRIFFLARH